MKKRIALFLLVAAVVLLIKEDRAVDAFNSAAEKERPFSELVPQQVRAVKFAVSDEVRNFAPAQPVPGEKSKKMGRAEEQAREIPNKIPFRKEIEGAPHDRDGAVSNILEQPMPLPSLSFDGISSSDNFAAYGFRILPPDTNGDVGLNHYVQSVNSLTRVYDKSGTPLTPPFKLSSIFAPLGTPCSMRNDGDPIVLYDQLADRWLISQFCSNFPPFRQLVAVSQTGDPTGAFFVYEFVMPNMKLNDYPKFGVWHDAYYMSTDEFFGSDYAGSGAFAFEREKLLIGDPSASYIYFDLASPTTLRIGGLLPTDHDGITPPNIATPNIFVGYTANEYGDLFDGIRLFNFRPDFANPSNSTFSERAESPIAVAAFDPTSNPGRDDIAQPAPGDMLDAQSDRLMYRVVYRNFGGHESLVFNQTVRVSPVGSTYQAGVRVYELRRSGGPFSVHDQGTLSPDELNRWMGSAAMDSGGNLAFGYSTGSLGKKPAIAYSGKLASEPAGSFRTEHSLVSGTGVQKAFGFRWGDYSALNVDPIDDCSFWITNEYYSLESQEESDFGWLTRIGKFKFEECVPANLARVRILARSSRSQVPIANARVKIVPALDASVAPITRVTGINGETETMRISPQNYSLVVSADGFRTTTMQFGVTNNPPDFTFVVIAFLEPTAVIVNAGSNIFEESCAFNGKAEPGERVSLNLALGNTGTINANNLVATLLSTGGVLNPSAPQNYGVLTVNGPPASRPFTFTVNPNLNCGTPVRLSFRLTDGANDLGIVTIDLPTGSPRIALSEEFDDLPLPNLPPGWTSSATGGQVPWTTLETRFESPPNSVFSPDPRETGVNELLSPPFNITSPNAEISFRNWYELETTFLRNRLYDGSLMEIKIGANDWQDIETAGGQFLQGGYDGVIDTCCQNPLGGRRGWSGRSGPNQTSEFITSRAKLPASAAGQTVQMRWRVGTDIGTFREGQYLDNIVVTDGFTCSCTVPQTNRAPFDFDGDGKTDLSVFQASDDPQTGDFRILNSSSNAVNNAAWGSSGDRPVSSDFDGDGKADLAVFRPSSNTWFIFRSSDSVIFTAQFGLSGDVLAPSDFDGDGSADIAVFRPSTGVWYALRSSDSQVSISHFGVSGDIPAPGDFDGDGKSDLAVFRPLNGTWYILRSTNGGVSIINFGLNGDKPVAGDFDGDSKTDLAVFRPGDQNWYLLKSSAGFSAIRFGLSDDRPLQADFDGDGRRDIGVFRPSSNQWFFIESKTQNVAVKQFGLAGDTPVPGIFVE
ncbi:MAG: VCBS repeat-containing protein [Pyrinomonadaceae bacterium]|nr:VCBS repeat-containing protein [Pyrinomonadaceae bacterium]